jgi:hypothetical protein
LKISSRAAGEKAVVPPHAARTCTTQDGTLRHAATGHNRPDGQLLVKHPLAGFFVSRPHSALEEAKSFLSKNPAPGVHLYQSGGLEGKMATQYGVLVLPAMFIVGKDGKCLSRNAQIGTLEEEIKKHVEK